MEQKEVNHEWKNIKSTILESAEEIIKTRGKHIHSEWWVEECTEVIAKNVQRPSQRMYRGHRKECTESIAKNVQSPSQRMYRGHRKECTEAIAKKNISRKKCLQKGTRANQEQYT